jgi:hypothetical protein
MQRAKALANLGEHRKQLEKMGVNERCAKLRRA